MTSTQATELKRLATFKPTHDAVILGIPFDLGAPRRGSGLATRAIRYAGLTERLTEQGLRVLDAGDVTVPDEGTPHSERLRNLPSVVEMAASTCEAARDAVRVGQVGVFLGGDHSVAIGTIAGVSSALAERQEHLGLLWFDAHGDFNTAQTTLSGHIHGMPFAVALGHGTPELTLLGDFCPKIRPENAVLIGARDLDPDEQALIDATGVKVFTMADVEERGIRAVVEEALAIASAGTAGIHLSFDMDVLDPREAPGVGSPVHDGMTAREARLAFKLVGKSGLLRGLDMVEVDPLLDMRNESARLAVELIAAAFTR
ncbi:MAG TPA: arginase [Stenomitos sp.]